MYTAQRNTGEVYQGVADAHDRFEVYSLVRKEGAKIVEINEEGNSVFQLIAKLNGQFSTVKEYDKILFARNLGSMLVAGLPLVRSLGVLERQARSPKLKSVVLELSSSVRRGDQLNVALKKFPHTFSSLFSAMVRAGEDVAILLRRYRKLPISWNAFIR